MMTLSLLPETIDAKNMRKPISAPPLAPGMGKTDVNSMVNELAIITDRRLMFLSPIARQRT